jgi:hypothetical protein
MLPEKESTCWLLTFSPTKPLILGGTVPYIYIIYIYTHHISCYQILSPSPWRRRRHRDPPGCGESSAERFPEILLAENFDQSRVSRKFSKIWWWRNGSWTCLKALVNSTPSGKLQQRMDLVHRSRIIQLGDAVWMPILSTENICQEKTYLHTWTSSYLTLINNSIY